MGVETAHGHEPEAGIPTFGQVPCPAVPRSGQRPARPRRRTPPGAPRPGACPGSPPGLGGRRQRPCPRCPARRKADPRPKTRPGPRARAAAGPAPCRVRSGCSAARRQRPETGSRPPPGRFVRPGPATAAPASRTCPSCPFPAPRWQTSPGRRHGRPAPPAPRRPGSRPAGPVSTRGKAGPVPDGAENRRPDRGPPPPPGPWSAAGRHRAESAVGATRDSPSGPPWSRTTTSRRPGLPPASGIFFFASALAAGRSGTEALRRARASPGAPSPPRPRQASNRSTSRRRTGISPRRLPVGEPRPQATNSA